VLLVALVDVVRALPQLAALSAATGRKFVERHPRCFSGAARGTDSKALLVGNDERKKSWF